MNVEDEKNTNESSIEREIAVEKLSELGFEANNENIETYVELSHTKQHPDGFEEITNNLDNPDKLKLSMQEKGIDSVIHSEGKTVWAHTELSIRDIESMEIAESVKNDLKIIMLYHDLGKTVASKNEVNIEQTNKKLANHELSQSMIGHQNEKLEDIENGLKANGVDGEKLEIYMTIIKNHMSTSIMEQDPKKTARLFDSFGENEEKIKLIVHLLTLVIQIDGNATGHIKLINGELDYSKNERKTNMDFVSVWNKYLEGKSMIENESRKSEKQSDDSTLEMAIFGKKLSDYLIQDKGIKPGPNFGKTIASYKDIIAKNSEKTPAEIKSILDSID